MKRACPKCGNMIDDDNSLNNFCIDCYLDGKELVVIPNIKLNFCMRCNKIKYCGRYFDDISQLEELIASHIKINEILEQPKVDVKLNLNFENNNYLAVINVKCIVGNKIKTITKEVKLDFVKDTCTICSRIAGHYYTAIIQLRFDDKKIQKLIGEKLLEEVDNIVDVINSRGKKESSTVHIIKEVKQKTGIDLYMDNKAMSQRIVNHLMKHRSAHNQQKSVSLVGVDQNGKRLYRHTFCVHFGKEKDE